MDRCLDSIEKQTYTNYELIIIDDCSIDNSYISLLEYKKKSNLNITLLSTEKNSGPGAARNLGIKYAKGKWLAFCDSDDWYDYRFLEKMYRTAKGNNADLIMCDSYQVFSNGKILKCGYTEVIPEEPSPKSALIFSRSSLCRLLVNKELFRFFDIPNLYYGEDVATIPQLIINSNKIKVLKEPLYYYQFRKESSSNGSVGEISKSFLKVFNILEEILEEGFEEELEYLGIRDILYAATLNGFKASLNNREIKKIILPFVGKYPNWPQNKYAKNFEWKKKIYLKCIEGNLLFLNRLYAAIHKILI